MKKLTALLLALMMIISFAACASTPSDGEHKNSGDNKTPSKNQNKNEIAFTELVVVDNEECSVKITKIDPDTVWGYTLKAQLENKSADKTYMFSIRSASVDGVETDPLFATEVAPGKKSNSDINIMDEELKENGIVDFTDIELSFYIYDNNDWEAEPVAETTAHIYPYGEEKATKYVRESKDSDNVIVDNENVTVVVTGYSVDEIWGYTVNLFIQNKTAKNVMFTTDEVSVNGYMIDPFFATSVSAGNCKFSSMSWNDTDFEDNGIADVEAIEFIFRAYDENDWLADDLANEKITLNP